MKTVGIILLTLGIAFFLFVIYSYVKSQNKTISPLPEDTGVKVIFITPAK